MKIGNFELKIGSWKLERPDAQKRYLCWTCKRKWKPDDHVEYLWHIHYCCAQQGAQVSAEVSRSSLR